MTTDLDWNRDKPPLDRAAKAAKEQAKRDRDARVAAADVNLDTAAAVLADGRTLTHRDRKAQLDAWIEQQLATLRAQAAQTLRSEYAMAYQTHDFEVYTADEIYDQDVERADAPVTAFVQAYNTAKAARKNARWADSPAGRKNAELAAEGERWAAREYQECVERGFPSAGWARWFAYDGMGTPDFTAYESARPWREKWLETHPHHRAMLESDNPDQWDAAEAQHRGREVVPRSDRHRWPA